MIVANAQAMARVDARIFQIFLAKGAPGSSGARGNDRKVKMSTLRTLRMRGNRQSTIENERVVDEFETVAVGLAISGRRTQDFYVPCPLFVVT